MKWIGEAVIVCILVWLGIVAASTYEEKNKFCPVEFRDDLTRLERVTAYVFFAPGMSIGCYLAEEGE